MIITVRTTVNYRTRVTCRGRRARVGSEPV